jgi:hypothetical protein
MLPRVLLHVIESPLPVDLSLDMSADGKRFAHEVPYRALFVFLYLFHENLQRCSIPRCRAQMARIERLSAARWVEGSTVQQQLPDSLSIAGTEFANVGYGSGECLYKRI